jgi:hypothetical protein
MTEWTTFADLRATLERRWRTGAWLRGYATGTEWQPMALPIKGPKADELLDRLAEVRSWVDGLARDCAATTRRPGLRIETRSVTNRRVGRNELPARAWVDSYDVLFGLLGVRHEVRRVDALLEATRTTVPALVPWAQEHPFAVLEHETVWTRVLATVLWIHDHDSRHLYLRQVDPPGVDTKFIEVHEKILASLLDQVLPADRVDERFGRTHFASRYRFRRKPDYTRMRLLAPSPAFPAGITEVRLRADELARMDPQLGRVIIVENEISYLALPDQPDTVAIFGSGFALGSVVGFSWLQDKLVTYWGDIDTYGFLILNRLRARYPKVESMLMDADTLLAHPLQWVSEDQPTNQPLPHLTEPEAALYRDLIEDRYGHKVRLEQERVRFSLVQRALGSR